VSQGKLSGRGGRVGSRGRLLGVHKDIAATDYPLLALDPPTYSVTPNREVSPEFQTRVTRSRRQQTALWVAGMAPAAVAAVVPASAWLVPARSVKPIRKPLERKIQTAPAMQWQYIAPTVAALDLDQQPFKVRYIRKIRLASPQVLFPPPTGPPAPGSAWALVKARTVSQRRRLQAQASQPSYPATSVTASPDRAVADPFQTRLQKSRKSLTSGAAPVYPATPAAQPLLPAFQAKATLRIKHSKKRLPQQYPVGVSPAAPPTSPATPAAIGTPTAFRRKVRHGLFLGGGADSALSAASTTAAVYPSFVPGGFIERRLTAFTLRTLVYPPVYPATSVVTSPDRVAAAPFVTFTTRSRRLLKPASVIGVDAAPPVTSQAPISALVFPKAERRRSWRKVKSAPDVIGVNPAAPPPPAPISALVTAQVIRRHHRPGLFLGGTVEVDGYTVAQPETAWRLPPSSRMAFKRRLLREQIQLLFPATPPVPEQPSAAYKLKTVTRSRYVRKLLPPDVQLEFPETPFVPPPPTSGYVGGGGGGGGGKRHKLRRFNKEIEDLVEQVSAELLYNKLEASAPQATKEAAKSIVKPYADRETKVVDWEALEADARRIGKLISLWQAEQARLKRIKEDDEWIMWEW